MDLALGRISSPTLMVASQLPEAPEASNGLLVGEAPRRVVGVGAPSMVAPAAEVEGEEGGAVVKAASTKTTSKVSSLNTAGSPGGTYLSFAKEYSGKYVKRILKILCSTFKEVLFEPFLSLSFFSQNRSAMNPCNSGLISA